MMAAPGSLACLMRSSASAKAVHRSQLQTSPAAYDRFTAGVPPPPGLLLPTPTSNLQAALERDGFGVVSVMNVTAALSHIANEKFDVLLSNLHMPRAGDGFTVVSAMRHTHPKAVTLLLRGYPEIDEALAAVRVQADEVL
jgi:hypothetical protein